MRSFIGMTAHYIIDNKLHKAMLACRRFRGSHTADNIYNMYQEICSIYNITGRVLRVVTDNASNMLKAFSLPGMEQSDSDESDNECEQLEGDEYFEHLSVERCSFFAHTLQLVIKDSLKDAPKINKVIAKASRFVTHTRKSTKATEILENSTKLCISNATRWNSQLKMLRSILRIPANVMDQLDFPDKLSANELKLIQELCDILLPFEEATDAVQGDNIVTASMVIVCVRGLRHQLGTSKKDTTAD